MLKGPPRPGSSLVPRPTELWKGIALGRYPVKMRLGRAALWSGCSSSALLLCHGSSLCASFSSLSRRAFADGVWDQCPKSFPPGQNGASRGCHGACTKGSFTWVPNWGWQAKRLRREGVEQASPTWCPPRPFLVPAECS